MKICTAAELASLIPLRFRTRPVYRLGLTLNRTGRACQTGCFSIHCATLNSRRRDICNQDNTDTQRQQALRETEVLYASCRCRKCSRCEAKAAQTRRHTVDVRGGAGEKFRTPVWERLAKIAQYAARSGSRYRRSCSCRRAFFSLSNRILCASVPSSMSDSLNQGCCRASFAVIRFLGS
jgi:hypothetical protein